MAKRGGTPSTKSDRQISPARCAAAEKPGKSRRKMMPNGSTTLTGAASFRGQLYAGGDDRLDRAAGLFRDHLALRTAVRRQRDRRDRAHSRAGRLRSRADRLLLR